VFIETALMISVFGFLIYLEPVGALSIGLFYGFVSIVFVQFSKKKLTKWGILRESVDNQLSKIVLEGIGGIKDLKILGRESYFLNQFNTKNYDRAKLNSNQETFSQIPRFYLELISIIGLVCFILLLLFLGRDSKSLITILGIFVAATFRLVPSINRILAAIQSMKFFTPSVELVVNELKNFMKPDQKLSTEKKITLQKQIEFKNVTFSHQEKEIILRKINLQIPKNKIVGIIGESGSGKSTLVDLIMGLQIPNKGEILIDNKPNFQISQNWRNNIGYVSQSIYLIDDSIKSNIAFGIPEELIDLKRIEKIIKKIQLEKLIGELKKGLDTNVGERGVQLSGGQKQRIGIARALYHNPDILIFDEATSALDTETEKEVMNSIYDLRKGKTIIIIAHRLSTLNNVDVLYKISNNTIKIV
jgi:ABC-type bacteriocin/lantibiotic exporter with double-glycine peptidase domain